MASSNLSVLVGKNFVCIKITGRANFATSPDFKTLVSELNQKGFSQFHIDLTECVLMDSTFLGVLAGFGLKLNPKGVPAESGIELCNASIRVAELLENLGAAHLFKMSSSAPELPADVQQSQAESIQPTHEQLARTSLEAHQVLMAMNPANVVRFKDVTQFLAEDLKNIEKAS